ncbi:hypothetical protein Tco_1377071 [Tanacetum coccineum]
MAASVFETYVKSKDLDLWHVITNGDPETKLDEVIPFEKQSDDRKKRLAKNNEAKMAKKESSDEESLTFGSEDEEYAMVVRDFKKFFKKKRCGDPNHLIGECPKPPKDKNQRAFIRGSWRDSGEEDDEKAKDETCLVAQASSEVCFESSYFSDDISSVDDITFDSEYYKFRKINLKIIFNNKQLKSVKRKLEKELIELKEKLSTLEKNKEVDLESSTSGSKEIKFVKPHNETSSGGGPSITEGGPHKAQTTPISIKGPPVCSSDVEKSVSFPKSILGPRPKHIMVNNVKIPVASDNEVKQFYKPSLKPGVGFSKPNFRSKTPPPRRVNNHYPRSKTPQPKQNVGQQNRPHEFPITWNNFQPQSYMPWGMCPPFPHPNQMHQMQGMFSTNNFRPMRY